MLTTSLSVFTSAYLFISVLEKLLLFPLIHSTNSRRALKGATPLPTSVIFKNRKKVVVLLLWRQGSLSFCPSSRLMALEGKGYTLFSFCLSHSVLLWRLCVLGWMGQNSTSLPTCHSCLCPGTCHSTLMSWGTKTISKTIPLSWLSLTHNSLPAWLLTGRCFLTLQDLAVRSPCGAERHLGFSDLGNFHSAQEQTGEVEASLCCCLWCLLLLLFRDAERWKVPA